MMNRRKFLGTTCLSCVGGAIGLTLVQSCSSTTSLVNAEIAGSDLVVPIDRFKRSAKDDNNYKSNIVVSNDQLSNPICIYRIDQNTYHAFLLLCTHQGAELQVFGDRMECPAHGSEFDINGVPTDGPATEPLRSFPVIVKDNQLLISLR